MPFHRFQSERIKSGPSRRPRFNVSRKWGSAAIRRKPNQMKAKVPGRFTAQNLSAVNEKTKHLRQSSPPIQNPKIKTIPGHSSDPVQKDQASISVNWAEYRDAWTACRTTKPMNANQFPPTTRQPKYSKQISPALSFAKTIPGQSSDPDQADQTLSP